MYKSITDANGSEHRNPVRSQISGKFNMKFLTEADYKEFVKLVKDNDQGCGLTEMHVYVTNLDEFEISNFYLEFTAGVSRSQDEKVYKKFTCNIKEY